MPRYAQNISKRLKTTFYILFALYIVLILANWKAIYSFSQMLGFVDAIKEGNIFYEIAIIIMAIFTFKKNKYVLPVSFILMTYWLCTMPVLDVNKYGLGAIMSVYYSFGFNQGFFLLLSSWLIPIASLVGCIYWYLDVKNSKSLDKHWSE